MSDAATTMNANGTAGTEGQKPVSVVEDKGKNKGKVVEDVSMEEDEDEEDEEEEDEEDVEEDEEEMAEDDGEEIDPAVILPQGRRTRGVKVDYTSAEALKKAGLENVEGDDEDDEDEDAKAK